VEPKLASNPSCKYHSAVPIPEQLGFDVNMARQQKSRFSRYSIEPDGSDTVSRKDEVEIADVQFFLALMKYLKTCSLSGAQQIRARGMLHQQ